MKVYRVTRSKWAANFAGSGVPSRWNARGSRVLYTASSIALAVLEILVHVDRDQIPEDYVWLAATIPTRLAIDVATEGLLYPAAYGTAWSRGSGAVALSVPSVIVPERNYILNPNHSDFRFIEWAEPKLLEIDPRLTRSAISKSAG